MCPPAQPPYSRAEIGLYWSDEQIFSFLEQYKPGFCLPDNVLADSSPFSYRPRNLPGISGLYMLTYNYKVKTRLLQFFGVLAEEIWHLVHLNEKKESDFGFWKPKGQACKIYSNFGINGWRSTLEYYEGGSHDARITDWVMQEYSITQKESLGEKNNPKELTSLCRVFRCNGSNHINGAHTSLKASVVPKTNNTSEQDSKSESKENSSPQETEDFECFSNGDFLELDDLEDPESHSSSSQNSSCPSKLSDESFDWMALLDELEEGDVADTEGKNLSSRYSITTSVKSNDVIMVPPSSGSIFTGAASTSKNEPLTDERMLEQSTKRDVYETGNEGTSNFCDANVVAILNEEKKENDGGRKKFWLKQYFCFEYF